MSNLHCTGAKAPNQRESSSTDVPPGSGKTQSNNGSNAHDEEIEALIRERNESVERESVASLIKVYAPEIHEANNYDEFATGTEIRRHLCGLKYPLPKILPTQEEIDEALNVLKVPCCDINRERLYMLSKMHLSDEEKKMAQADLDACVKNYVGKNREVSNDEETTKQDDPDSGWDDPYEEHETDGYETEEVDG